MDPLCDATSAGLVSDDFDEEFCGFFAEFDGKNVDGGEGRGHECGEIDAVEPDDAEFAGNIEGEFVCSLVDAHGAHVVETKEGRRSGGGIAEYLEGGLIAGGGGFAGVDDEGVGDGYVVVDEALDETELSEFCAE